MSEYLSEVPIHLDRVPSEMQAAAMCDEPTYRIGGREVRSTDPHLPQILAGAYERSQRPRCMCQPQGVEMCIVKDGLFYLRRMPKTGSAHHPTCDWFELPPCDSGLGYLLGESVMETPSGTLQVHTDFPLQRSRGQRMTRGVPTERNVVQAKRRALTMRGLLHLIWERAKFNRWSPNMRGKRHWGVIRHYCLLACADIELKGLRLSQRVFIPEPFQAERAAEIRARREAVFSTLVSPEHENTSVLMLLIGELKDVTKISVGYRLVIKHLPDTPFLLDERTGSGFIARFAEYFRIRKTLPRTKLIVALTFAARSADDCHVDTITMMTVSEDWIPFHSSPERRLLDALVCQGRRFIKSLDYDTPSSVLIPDFVLLDPPLSPVRLFVIGGERGKSARRARGGQFGNEGNHSWVWHSDRDFRCPDLPPAGERTRPGR